MTIGRSGTTQQDLPVLPLDFVTHVYTSARILLHVYIHGLIFLCAIN